MNIKSLLILVLSVTVLSVNAQIMVNGKASNEIYSYTDNVVTYMSTRVCEGMHAQIDGGDKIEIEANCSFDLNLLKKESSQLSITDQEGKTVLETELIRNPNLPTAYIVINEKEYVAGSIAADDIQTLEEVKVVFPCPWMSDVEIYGFTLMVMDAAQNYMHYDIEGAAISQEIRDEILSITEKSKLIVTDILFDANKYLHSINSVALDIE